MKHFAVIPTVGERDTLIPLVQSLIDQNVRPIVVHNERGEHWRELVLPAGHHLHHHVWQEDEPVNLSRLWNIGLVWAEEMAGGEEYAVAVLNDDLTLPVGFVQTLAERMMANDAAGAFPSLHVPQEYVLRHGGPSPLHVRMTGWAFVLRGSKDLLADERLLWWYGDDDLSWRAQLAGGMVGVPMADAGIVHHDAGGYTTRTPALAEQAGRDRQKFAEIWGTTPW